MNMINFKYFSSVLLLFSIGSVSADDSGKDLLPKQPRYAEYVEILEKDPFGGLEKPPVKVAVKEVEKVEEEPKEQYVLKGVSKFSDGWFVVLANKKTPKEDVMIHQNKENDLGIKILGVKQAKYDFTKTIVTIKSEDVKQDISYNPAFFTKTKTKSKEKDSNASKNPKGKDKNRSFSRPNGKSSSKGKK